MSGDRARFFVRAAGGEPLRICLAYTDLPGRALQNNLNLLVEEPSGNKRIGNEHVPMALNPSGEYLSMRTTSMLLSGSGILRRNRVLAPHRPPLASSMPSEETAIAEVVDLDRVRRRDLLGGCGVQKLGSRGYE